MFTFQPYQKSLSANPEGRSNVHIPMIYERYEPEATYWEYHVLRIDTREASLPDAEQLNALGREGWLMSGLVDERASGGKFVYYYFMRQAVETDKEQKRGK